MNTVLCVDSDQGELEKTKIILQENGYNVVLAKSPGEAMEWLSHNPPTIILTEIDFPGMDSEKVIRNFIKINPDSVFIIYTKREERRIGDDRRLDKIFEFISKPSDNLTLIGHLKRAAAFGRKRIELKEFVNETRKKINRQLEWSIWEESKYLEERKRFGINILENIHHSMNQGDGLGSLITLIDMLEYHKQETDDGKFILSGEIINTLNQTASTVRSWMQNMLKIPVMLRKEYETEFLSEEEINRIIDESIESLDEFKKIKNHTILKDQMEIPFRIQANREVMEISIKELITNAFKYSPTDSEIRIFSQRAGNSLSILISNTVNHIEGSLTGIPRELENRLFEPFVRVNNLHDDRYHKDTFGMGTGLTLVYHSISQVGGKLYLYESHSAENNSNGSKKVIAEMIFPIDHSVSQESSSD